MIPFHALCAPLLPPHERRKFPTLIIDAPHRILGAAMMAPQATGPACRHAPDRLPRRDPRTRAA